MEANLRRLNSQQDLFSEVLHAYCAAEDNTLSNQTLYDLVAAASGMSREEFRARVPVGRAGKMFSLNERRARWHQQSLAAAGILERVPAELGIWRLKGAAAKKLYEIDHSTAVVGFSTDLGVAIIGSCDTVFTSLREEVHAIITSPPYCLAHQRSYGNVSEANYVGWLIKTLTPLVRNLANGGTLSLNITQDRFLTDSPARSTYVERLILALCDELGLSLVDRLIWASPTKPPGPVRYASVQRVQLNVGYEFVLVFTNNPHKLRLDNRRVLEEHSERHLKLMLGGGERRETVSCDGAYRIKNGSYGALTEGRIPRNVLTFPHTDKSQQLYKAHARSIGLPAHPAPFPLSLSDFLVKFMTEPGDLVVDPMAGSQTLALSAERLGRRWMTTEVMLSYVFGASWRFREAPGYCLDLAA